MGTPFESIPEYAGIVNNLQKWAESRPEIARLIVYGSRARGDHHPNSDFDLAVEIIPGPYDSDAFAVWIHEANQWRAEISPMIPWVLQLEWHDVDGDTPTVSKGIADGNYLVFERTKGQVNSNAPATPASAVQARKPGPQAAAFPGRLQQ